MTSEPPDGEKRRAGRLSRSRFFWFSLLFHLIILILIAAWIIFPATKPGMDSSQFGKADSVCWYTAAAAL